MKIIVLIKQTFDTEASIVLDANGEIVNNAVKLIMNPYDEFAVEEAIRIKEAQGGEITVVSMGNEDVVVALKLALSMGCDNAVLLNDPAFQGGDEYSAATALAAYLQKMDYDLILSGWVAIDSGSAQTALRVAESLNLPQISLVTKLEIADKIAVGEREIDGATMKVEVPLPALITVQKGINEPRYPGMKGIMAAKKKQVQMVSAADLGLDPAAVGKQGAKTSLKERYLPPKRQACNCIAGDDPQAAAAKLVQILRDDIKVI